MTCLVIPRRSRWSLAGIIALALVTAMQSQPGSAQDFGDTPYVHIDIAGPARSDEDSFERVTGATGAGVRTLVEYVLAQ